MANGCLSSLLWGGQSQWVGKMWGGITLSIRWGCCRHVPGSPECFALGCELREGVFSFRDRIYCGKGGVRRDLERSRDPRAAWCSLLLFPFSDFCLGWEKEKVNSLASTLKTLHESLLLTVSYNTFCFLWKILYHSKGDASSLKIALSSVLFLKVGFSSLILSLSRKNK